MNENDKDLVKIYSIYMTIENIFGYFKIKLLNRY